MHTAPARTGKGSRSQALADGSKVEIQQLGDQHHVAKLVHDGQILGTVEANGQNDGLDANGVHIVFGAGGEISAHE
ncbi:hypothetical protein ACIG0C_34520 [Kitasatospora aureofaciens]|uniref:Uncharacterized protein n=1 Tax=Kitasatospora aureofaciens TaxID=1894 RepID=A0A1E7NEY1_KITAU|nr:hypothetical protein [Kitasatospora aureofaciens]QEV03172.1 hypothetical protein CP971_31675 [Streptomyces viridifaciens]ARF82464.1 hypothetical protein B6264_29540 [Kitasatospora aureofaciens]OEV39266.1 hypothetical protein HS99_0000675 [Kitasatospora aureofaciens]UKZ09835.1 hypothetical protein BOQ63_038645 [Streptomyces viridifaciens]GGU88325.1 hypothetical protein GCM10010502_46270 [Kitasatospora aureofaciens]